MLTAAGARGPGGSAMRSVYVPRCAHGPGMCAIARSPPALVLACIYTRAYGWRSTDEDPAQRTPAGQLRPRLPAVAHPRADGRLSRRGRVAAPRQGWAGGLRPARGGDCLVRSVARVLASLQRALRAAMEARRAAGLGRSARRHRRAGADAAPTAARRPARRADGPELHGRSLQLGVRDRG